MAPKMASEGPLARRPITHPAHLPTPAPHGLAVASHSESIRAGIEAAAKIPNHIERWSRFAQIAEQLETVQNIGDQLSEMVWERMSMDTKAWQTLYGSFDAMQRAYYGTMQAAQRSKAARDRRQEALYSIENAGLPDEDWAQVMPFLGPDKVPSQTVTQAAATFSKVLSAARLRPADGVRIINRQVYERLSTSAGRGGIRARFPVTVDYTHAVNKKTMQQLCAAEALTGAELDQFGLVRGPAAVLIDPKLQHLAASLLTGDAPDEGGMGGVDASDAEEGGGDKDSTGSVDASDVEEEGGRDQDGMLEGGVEFDGGNGGLVDKAGLANRDKAGDKAGPANQDQSLVQPPTGPNSPPGGRKRTRSPRPPPSGSEPPPAGTHPGGEGGPSDLRRSKRLRPGANTAGFSEGSSAEQAGADGEGGDGRDGGGEDDDGEDDDGGYDDGEDGEGEDDDGEYLSGTAPFKGGANARPRCSCSADVSRAWRSRVAGFRIKKAVPDRVAVARSFQALIATGAVICHYHIKAAAASVGLRNRGIGETLRYRLKTYAEHGNDIGQLHVGGDTYRWFNRMARPPHPDEELGVYKYGPLPPKPFAPAVEVIRADIELAYGLSIADTFGATGNIHVPAFLWWFDRKIEGPAGAWGGGEVSVGDLALVEFDMYLWHLRTDAGNSGSLGWLRSMYHSGIQQLMRMDPEYYRCYVALRPDRQWRIVSYPYYAKYSRVGDYTVFRHIDINVSQYLVDGRGGSMIQGSVSLDDEAEDMCTEILPGMHERAKVEDWHRRVTGRSAGQDRAALSDWVSRVQDRKVWSQEDRDHFGVDFTPVPCRRGDARITSPLLPHGSTSMPGRPGAVRRTMLPWFVGIQDDHSTMEVAEMGTWEDISRAHIGLVAAARSPSGKPNNYGAIPYRFPAATPLRHSSALSNALVGRNRWDVPDVMEERDVILGSDTAAYKSWREAWRKEAASAYLAYMIRIRRVEQEVFGDKSFFRNGATLEAGTAPAADSEADSEVAEDLADIVAKEGAGYALPDVHGQEGAMPGSAAGAPDIIA